MAQFPKASSLAMTGDEDRHGVGRRDGPVLAAVMACHNRRELTLDCLSRLYGQDRADQIRLSVYLFDDGSTDGTAQAVTSAFPEVRIIPGDGNQFWGGGMHHAMRAAGTAGYDFMLWLNDDVVLSPDALAKMLADYEEAKAREPGREHIIVASLTNPHTAEVQYGGMRRRSRWHPAQLDTIREVSGDITPCDTMNGNCVLVPLAVVRRIGFLDRAFVHQIGDVDYGYRAIRAGIGLWITSTPVGTCDCEPRPRPWLKRGLTLRERWHLLNTPRGTPLKPWLTFMWRHGGIVGLAALVVSYKRALFPGKTATD